MLCRCAAKNIRGHGEGKNENDMNLWLLCLSLRFFRPQKISFEKYAKIYAKLLIAEHWNETSINFEFPLGYEIVKSQSEWSTILKSMPVLHADEIQQKFNWSVFHGGDIKNLENWIRNIFGRYKKFYRRLVDQIIIHKN